MIELRSPDGTLLARSRRVDCDWLAEQGATLVLLAGPHPKSPVAMRERVASLRARRLFRALHEALSWR